MVIEEKCVCIADADTTLVQSFYQIFTPRHAMDIDAQVNSSGSALSCNVVGDHGGQTDCGRANVSSFSLRLF